MLANAPSQQKPDRNAPVIAWGMAVLSLVLIGSSILLLLAGRAAWPKDFPSWPGQLAFTLVMAGPPVLGALIVSRQPGNRYGWLWCVFSLNWAFTVLAEPYAAYGLVIVPGSLPGVMVVAVLTSFTFTFGVTLIPFILLWFPDGKLHTPRLRWFAWLIVFVGAAGLLLAYFYPGNLAYVPIPNPYAASGNLGWVSETVVNVAIYIIFLSVIISAGLLIWRMVSVQGVERQQIKWFAFAAALFSLRLLVDLIYPFIPEIIGILLDSATLAGLYLAIGFAILRYRLYDIDFIIRRTLVYGALTAILAVLYFGAVLVFEQVSRALIGTDSPLSIVLSTLSIAALVSPLRRRLQEVIDRRFYRRKYNASRILEGFSASLRNEVDLEHFRGHIVKILDETVQPDHISLWLRRPAVLWKQDR